MVGNESDLLAITVRAQLSRPGCDPLEVGLGKFQFAWRRPSCMHIGISKTFFGMDRVRGGSGLKSSYLFDVGFQ